MEGPPGAWGRSGRRCHPKALASPLPSCPKLLLGPSRGFVQHFLGISPEEAPAELLLQLHLPAQGDGKTRKGMKNPTEVLLQEAGWELVEFGGIQSCLQGHPRLGRFLGLKVPVIPSRENRIPGIEEGMEERGAHFGVFPCRVCPQPRRQRCPNPVAPMGTRESTGIHLPSELGAPASAIRRALESSKLLHF